MSPQVFNNAVASSSDLGSAMGSLSLADKLTEEVLYFSAQPGCSVGKVWEIAEVWRD